MGCLQQPKLSSSIIAFQSFSKFTTTSQGKCYLKLGIENQSMHTTFHVAWKDKASVDMILGESWMAQTNCLIDWSSRSSTLCINSINITCFSADMLSSIPNNSSNGDDSSSHSIEDTTTKVYVQDDHNIGFAWQVYKPFLSTQAH